MSVLLDFLPCFDLGVVVVNTDVVQNIKQNNANDDMVVQHKVTVGCKIIVVPDRGRVARKGGVEDMLVPTEGKNIVQVEEFQHWPVYVVIVLGLLYIFHKNIYTQTGKSLKDSSRELYIGRQKIKSSCKGGRKK